MSGTRANYRLIALIGLVAVPAVPWEPELPRDVSLLVSIRGRMQQNLSRIPSYTCLETITRGQHAAERLVIAVPGKSVPFRRVDTVRLEVAEIKGAELFARPGEHNFENRELRELVPGGLIGNGIFSGFAHDVFRSDSVTNHFAGEEQINGRTLFHYTFRVPQLFSGYRVGTDYGHAIVGYHGSFWADTQTLDTVRLEVLADEIPAYTGLTNVSNRIDFARVRIGGSDVLLPQSAEMTSRVLDGAQSRNQIAFTHCREYGVEARINFDDVDNPGEGKPGGINYVELPAGLLMTIRLESAIDAGTSHIGDVIAATVDMDAKHKGSTVVPKDAVISGRLRRLEQHKEGWPYVLAGLEFTRIEFEGKEARFFAALEKLILPPGVTGIKRIANAELPGVGMVSTRGDTLRLPAGTLMVWKTISYEQAANAGSAGTLPGSQN